MINDTANARAKRMISNEIINQESFVKMPNTAKLLYIYLILNADDDGFCSRLNEIGKLLGSKEDDVDILSDNGYIIVFESGVVAVRHWLKHNTIHKDRYTATSCIEMELIGVDNNGAYQLLEKCQEERSR